MRIKLERCAILFALSFPAAHGQKAWPAACCKPDVQFKVKTDKKTTPLAPPDAGMAQIVFLAATDGDFFTPPTVRFATDGAWAGAAKGASYFTVSIDVGRHTLCTARQSSAKDELEKVGTATINAEPGKTYFYQFKVVRTEVGSPERIGGSAPGTANNNMATCQNPTVDTVTFSRLKEDEARNLFRKSPVSTSTTKP
jgi:hypothetical protein